MGRILGSSALDYEWMLLMGEYLMETRLKPRAVTLSTRPRNPFRNFKNYFRNAVGK